MKGQRTELISIIGGVLAGVLVFTGVRATALAYAETVSAETGVSEDDQVQTPTTVGEESEDVYYDGVITPEIPDKFYAIGNTHPFFVHLKNCYAETVIATCNGESTVLEHLYYGGYDSYFGISDLAGVIIGDDVSVELVARDYEDNVIFSDSVSAVFAEDTDDIITSEEYIEYFETDISRQRFMGSPHGYAVGGYASSGASEITGARLVKRGTNEVIAVFNNDWQTGLTPGNYCKETRYEDKWIVNWLSRQATDIYWYGYLPDLAVGSYDFQVSINGIGENFKFAGITITDQPEVTLTSLNPNYDNTGDFMYVTVGGCNLWNNVYPELYDDEGHKVAQYDDDGDVFAESFSSDAKTNMKTFRLKKINAAAIVPGSLLTVKIFKEDELICSKEIAEEYVSTAYFRGIYYNDQEKTEVLKAIYTNKDDVETSSYFIDIALNKHTGAKDGDIYKLVVSCNGVDPSYSTYGVVKDGHVRAVCRDSEGNVIDLNDGDHEHDHFVTIAPVGEEFSGNLTLVNYNTQKNQRYSTIKIEGIFEYPLTAKFSEFSGGKTLAEFEITKDEVVSGNISNLPDEYYTFRPGDFSDKHNRNELYLLSIVDVAGHAERIVGYFSPEEGIFDPDAHVPFAPALKTGEVQTALTRDITLDRGNNSYMDMEARIGYKIEIGSGEELSSIVLTPDDDYGVQEADVTDKCIYGMWRRRQQSITNASYTSRSVNKNISVRDGKLYVDFNDKFDKSGIVVLNINKGHLYKKADDGSRIPYDKNIIIEITVRGPTFTYDSLMIDGPGVGRKNYNWYDKEKPAILFGEEGVYEYSTNEDMSNAKQFEITFEDYRKATSPLYTTYWDDNYNVVIDSNSSDKLTLNDLDHKEYYIRRQGESTVLTADCRLNTRVIVNPEEDPWWDEEEDAEYERWCKGEMYYDGTEQTADVIIFGYDPGSRKYKDVTDQFTITGNKRTDAGQYTMTPVQKNGKNEYRFNDGDLDFEIRPLEPWVCDVDYDREIVYTGKSITPVVRSITYNGRDVSDFFNVYMGMDPDDNTVVKDVKDTGWYYLNVTAKPEMAGNVRGSRYCGYDVVSKSLFRSVITIVKKLVFGETEYPMDGISSIKLDGEELLVNTDISGNTFVDVSGNATNNAYYKKTRFQVMGISGKDMSGNSISDAGVYHMRIYGQGNYDWYEDATFEITKAKAPAKVDDITATASFVTGKLSVQFTSEFLEKAKPTGYTPGTAATTGSVKVSDLAVSAESVLSASVTGAAEGDTITVPLSISSKNYKDFNANLVITLVKEVNGYLITYDLAGGALPAGEINPVQYDGSAAITLKNPIRDGYTFAGWTGTDLSAATVSVVIPEGASGNRTYTATWIQNESEKPAPYVPEEPDKTEEIPAVTKMIDGEEVTVNLDVTFKSAVLYTGKAITPKQLGIEVDTTDLENLLAGKIEGNEKGIEANELFKVTYVSNKKKAAGSEATMYGKITFDEKKAKKAGLNKDQREELKKLVKELNKNLKKNKAEYEIKPIDLSDTAYTVKVNVSKMKKGKMIVKNGKLKNIKSVKVETPAKKTLTISTKQYTIEVVDAEANTVRVIGKGNYTGTSPEVTVTKK